MRAWHVDRPGPVGTDGGDRQPLVARDTPVPVPGPGELLLRVLACGVCRTDLHVAEGDLPVHRPGVTPGHEVVGEVVAAGPGDVAGFAVGDRAGRGLAALDRRHLPVLHARRGEPVPRLEVHRLGRGRRLRRVPDRPRGVRPPAAGGLLRRSSSPRCCAPASSATGR